MTTGRRLSSWWNTGLKVYRQKPLHKLDFIFLYHHHRDSWKVQVCGGLDLFHHRNWPGTWTFSLPEPGGTCRVWVQVWVLKVLHCEQTVSELYGFSLTRTCKDVLSWSWEPVSVLIWEVLLGQYQVKLNQISFFTGLCCWTGLCCVHVSTALTVKVSLCMTVNSHTVWFSSLVTDYVLTLVGRIY